MKDVVTNNKQNILLYIVIGLVVWNLFNVNSVKTDVKSYEKKIESIQVEIDSTKMINNGIDKKIDSIKTNVVNITKEINDIDKNITIIKKQTDEKVNSVDTFSVGELEQFFTNRYDKKKN